MLDKLYNIYTGINDFLGEKLDPDKLEQKADFAMKFLPFIAGPAAPEIQAAYSAGKALRKSVKNMSSLLQNDQPEETIDQKWEIFSKHKVHADRLIDLMANTDNQDEYSGYLSEFANHKNIMDQKQDEIAGLQLAEFNL